MRTIDAIRYDIQQAINSIKFMLFRHNLNQTNVYVSAIYTSAGALLLNSRGQRLIAR
jgi:hypothetical protein